jgi:hypothetical protein
MDEKKQVIDKPRSWREIHKAELVNFVRQFYRTSYDWRSQAFHTKWDNRERNFRNIYNPQITIKKEPWQATMFIPATSTNVEVISTALTKIGGSTKRPLSLEPREMGDELQAELNTDLLDYYRIKGEYEIARYDAIKEACIFGSGFIKCFWEKKTAKRLRKTPIIKTILDAMRKFKIPKISGEKNSWQDVLVKNGVRYQKVHIRDIFLEPNSTDMKRLIHRDKLTYNELRQMANIGYFDKDSVDQLWMVRESDNFETDISPVKYDLSQTDPKLARPNYDKRHTVWEYNGPLPLKWINLDMPEDTEDQKKEAEEITPGVALIASGNYFLASGESQNYDGEPPFVKVDYIRSGGTYGIGVAELMEGLQDELNEIRNQRIDNVTLIMNRMIAIIEKYVVDPKELRSKPGGVIRFKGSEIDDIRKVFSQIEISDVPLSAFRETGELERQIQEATAANRVTIGTTTGGKDANQTLGGMELLKQAAFDRFTVYAFIIGRSLDINIIKKTCELVYLNIDDESLTKILGIIPVEYLPGVYMPRWELWKRHTPEDLNIFYDYVPVDVFSQENAFQKSQDLLSYGQFLASVLPTWNPLNLAKKLGKLKGFTSQETQEIIGDIQNPIPTPMGMGQGVPSISRPTQQTSSETPPIPTPSPVGPSVG